MADALDSLDLPAVCRDRKTNYLRRPLVSDLDEIVKDDLSTSRVEELLPQLWMVGRPYPPRPLNIQSVLGRKIVATDDISLHLVWAAHKIFVKPLPAYLLTNTFYDNHLVRHPDRKPNPLALGLIYSYCALIQTRLDFALAHKSHLFPDHFTWQDWKNLTAKILGEDEYSGEQIYKYIPRRYVYGELRLGRLNKISRFMQGDIMHGYSPLTGNTRYVDFFSENQGIVAASAVYVVVVLSAMQVGLATDTLAHNPLFQGASFGFSVLAIFGPVLALGATVTIFLLMFFVNWALAIQRGHKRFNQLGMSPESFKEQAAQQHSAS